jgi:hypothetical protein
MKALGWVLTILLLPGCGERKDIGPGSLDEEAIRTCAVFEDLIADYDTLTEAEIRDLTLQMWEDAQVSQTTGIRRTAREFLSVVFVDLPSRFYSAVKDLREACAGRASPYPNLGSNDQRG